MALPAVLALLALGGCRRKHVPTGPVPELPYPSCGARPLPPGEIVAAGHLRPGETSLEKAVNERFEVRRRDCLVVATVRQEWPLATSDVEIVYDARTLAPLRAWRRQTVPGVPRPDGYADTRRYELRGAEVTSKRRAPDGAVTYEVLRGGRPTAVIAPGRGLLTLWLRRARLAVGAQTREWVLDLREPLEKLSQVTLRRDADMALPWLGRPARVYTFYGRETVFADETDAVIGDLAGLRPSATLRTPEPPPLPRYGEPDPVHTP